MPDILSRTGLRRMIARDDTEHHRASTPLELLFDLVFVVAVSQASVNLHHLISEDHVGQGVLAYLMVFFAIWWAWMNFTWFSSAFDTDDWLYRIMTVLQMSGVLVLAAGIHAAMTDYDYTVVTVGYVIMRLALVGQWLRAAASDPASRPTALRFAGGVTLVQVLWVARLFLPEQTGIWTFFVLACLELAVPLWAESKGRTHWHAEHIVERFGLFTLLLLGESLLASASAMFDALGEGEHVPELIGLAVSGIAVTAGIWWIYFARDQVARISSNRGGFRFGYFHYAIFVAVGAVSAGVEVEIDHITGATPVSGAVAGLALTLPIAVFVVAVWALLLRPFVATWTSVLTLVAAVLIGMSGLLEEGEYIVAAALLAGLVAALELDAARDRSGVVSSMGDGWGA